MNLSQRAAPGVPSLVRTSVGIPDEIRWGLKSESSFRIENGQPEIHGVQGRDRTGPEQFKIRIGRIEEGQHVRVQGEEEERPPEADVSLEPVLVTDKEVLFPPEGGDRLPGYGPSPARREGKLPAVELGYVQGEPGEGVSLGVEDLQARVPVELGGQGFVPKSRGRNRGSRAL